MNAIQIIEGDCKEQLRRIPEASAHCCVTSPPYWGLRDYGVTGQIGLEETIEGYLEEIVKVFREVHRVLRDDGTLWINLGDCYAASGWSAPRGHKGKVGLRGENAEARLGFKNLIGIPWRVALALQEDGWILRSDIIWHKPNPLPESVTDRPTKAHEYLFLLSKAERYYYDAEAVKEKATGGAPGNIVPCKQQADYENGERRQRNKAGLLKYAQAARLSQHRDRARANGGDHDSPFGSTRNKRSVWTVPTHAYADAHFATFPPDLIKPCILAGCPAGGTVLDPFAGSGTTGAVAIELGRQAVLIELNPNYVELCRHRTAVTPGFQFPSS